MTQPIDEPGGLPNSPIEGEFRDISDTTVLPVVDESASITEDIKLATSGGQTITTLPVQTESASIVESLDLTLPNGDPVPRPAVTQPTQRETASVADNMAIPKFPNGEPVTQPASLEGTLGELPDSPVYGRFTARSDLGGPQTPGTGGGGGSWTPKPGEGTYTSPSNEVSHVGYEVLVLAGPNFEQAIALIASHQGLQLTRQLSGDGGGVITLNRDSPLFYNSESIPTNLILNPNFQSPNYQTPAPQGGIYAWGWRVHSEASAATIGTTTSWLSDSGAANNSIYINSPGTGNPKFNTLEGQAGISVSPHTNMTATAQAKPTTVGRPTRLYVDFFDAAGARLPVGQSIRGTPVVTEPNVVNYLRVDGSVPEDARFAAVGIEVSASGVTGEQHRFDNFAFYQTAEMTPFYDGRDKSDLIDKENLWLVFYNGKPIHEFLGIVRSSDLVNTSESRTVVVSGVGTIELLKRIRLLPAAWSLRDGKPWVVSPIKMLKEDFKSGTDSSVATLNTKIWNKQITMNVSADLADPNFPKVQIMNVAQMPAQEKIGTGPWNMRNAATLPGDQSGIPNTLYFQAVPFLLPVPQPNHDPDGSTTWFPADFRNVFEIYIDDKNRCYVMIRSTLTTAGVLTNRLYSVFLYTDQNGVYRGEQQLATTTYNANSHKWFQFRMGPNDQQFFIDYSTNGINWSNFAAKTLTSAHDAWIHNIDQVTFRSYGYFTGVPHAYDPVGGRPYTETGQQGYTPGTNPNIPTTLLPVGKVTSTDGSAELYDNPAFTSFGKINNNGIPDTKSPVYDQMGYYWWKSQNARSSDRAVLSNVTFNWTAGNYRTGVVVQGTDSIGNRRKGTTQTYYKTASIEQVNPQFITPSPPLLGVKTLVPTGTTRAGSFKGTDGKLYYYKYTYTDPTTKAQSEAFQVKAEVTLPVDGNSFYDYFIQSCNIAKCDWSMRPGRKLEIYDSDPDLTGVIADPREAYFHTKEPVVFFHEGYTTISKQMAKSTESIANYVIGHDTKGNYAVAKDNNSIAKWGVRETWVSVDYSDPTSVSLELAVSTILAMNTNEIESWTISVPVMDGVRPFVDYKEGDWVYVAKHTGADPSYGSGTKDTGYLAQYDKFRVMAISLSVGLNSEETVELTLTSLVEDQMKILQARLNNVSATSAAAVSFIPPVSAIAQISNAGLNGLGNVSVEGAEAGSYLRLSSSGVWVAQPADNTPDSIPTAYDSGPLGNGSTLYFTITHNLGTVDVIVRVIGLIVGAAGFSRDGPLSAVGEDITNAQMLRQNEDGTTEIDPAPVLIQSAIPIIYNENQVKIAFTQQKPFTAPQRNSFRVIVMRGRTDVDLTGGT